MPASTSSSDPADKPRNAYTRLVTMRSAHNLRQQPKLPAEAGIAHAKPFSGADTGESVRFVTATSVHAAYFRYGQTPASARGTGRGGSRLWATVQVPGQNSMRSFGFGAKTAPRGFERKVACTLIVWLWPPSAPSLEYLYTTAIEAKQPLRN